MMVDLTKFPCSYCKKRIDKAEDAKMCPHCHVVMHKKCWEENKGCTTPGCKGRFNSSAMSQSKTPISPVDPKKIDPFHGLDRKQEEKLRQLLSKYGLDELNNINDINSICFIAAKLFGTGLLESGMTISALGGDKSINVAEQTQTYYQRAMLEQNWIIIRQLDQLNKNIERLLEK